MSNTKNVVDLALQRKEFLATPDSSIAEIYPGFSERFNLLIDLTDLHIPPLKGGRLTHLCELFELSRPVPGEWLMKDKPPKASMLRKIVSFLLAHLDGEPNVYRVEAWLKYGDAIGNPFDQPHSTFHPLTPLATVLVNNEAKKMGYSAPDFNLDATLSLTIETLTDFELTAIEQITPGHLKIIGSHVKANLK